MHVTRHNPAMPQYPLYPDLYAVWARHRSQVACPSERTSQATGHEPRVVTTHLRLRDHWPVRSQISGHRSQVTSHLRRSQVTYTGRRSQVTSHLHRSQVTVHRLQGTGHPLLALLRFPLRAYTTNPGENVLPTQHFPVPCWHWSAPCGEHALPSNTGMRSKHTRARSTSSGSLYHMSIASVCACGHATPPPPPRRDDLSMA